MSIAELCANYTNKEIDTGKLLDKNIMEFVTAPWGLGLGATPDVPPLYPAQRFILKTYYGLELDKSSNRDIIIKDQFNEVELYRFNESEYARYLYEEHRINVDNFGERPNLVLVCGRRSGKCVTGDTLVLTDNGIIRIEELGVAPDEGFVGLNIGVAQESGRRARSLAFYNGGVKDVFKITSKDGFSIRGTAGHRVKVMSSDGIVVWKYLCDIEEGDYLAINRGTNLWSEHYIPLGKVANAKSKSKFSSEVLNESLSELLGYLVGSRSRDRLCVLSLILKRYGDCGFLEGLGLFGNEKQIPWSVLRSPKTVVCSFLKGLFEAGGVIGGNGPYITFSTPSYSLSKEIQIVLLNLGVVSAIKETMCNKKAHYVLSIKGLRSVSLFARLVWSGSKKELREVIATLKIGKGHAFRGEKIPNQKYNVKRLIRSINGEMPSEKEFLKKIGRNLNSIGLRKLLELAKECRGGESEIDHFEKLMEMDYYYTKVSSIESGREQVYDLNVPDGSSFVANGMTNHNTTVTACIIAYETYKLLNKYCPQEYFGIMPEDDIRFTCISTGKDTAAELFNKVTGHIERCEFFRKFRDKPTKQRMVLRSQRDIDKYGQSGRATISINVAPCSAKGLRGHNNMIVALDEMAFFFADEKNSGVGASDKNDRAIYNAVTPSVAKFKTPDGSPAGRVICISSPYGKTGKFYGEYSRAFEDTNDDLLTIQAPTWEIDPDLSTKYLKSKYQENPKVFKSEFGAEFSDEICAWIEDPIMVRQNIVPGLRYKVRSFDRVPHFVGIDIGLKGDGTAIVVGHWTKEKVENEILDRLEVDCCDVRYAKDEGKDFFTPEEMADWIAEYKDRYYVVKGLMDQYYGMSIIPSLEKKGQKMYEYRHFSDTVNSSAYQNLLATMISSTLRLPEEAERIIDGKPTTDSDLVLELLTLQSEQRSKYLIKVHAPDREDAHDDASDAFSRMVLVATEYKISGAGHKISAPSTSGRAHDYRKSRVKDMMRASLNRPSGARGFGAPSMTRQGMSGPSFSRTFR